MKKTTQTLLAVMAGVLIGSGVSFVRDGMASRSAPRATTVSESSPHDLLEEVKERVSSEYVELLLTEPELKPLVDLPRMAELARGMVDDALQAFLTRDTEKAKETLKTDDVVDALNDQIFRELLTYAMGNAENLTRCMALILVSRSLERIADHATNICEEVVYMVKGEDIRHQAEFS